MNSTPSRANSMMVPFETGVDEQSVTILANDNHENGDHHIINASLAN